MRTLSHAHVAGESHGIDLAPMLDFVVNLLIFFIITAVFVRQGGLEVRRPSTDSEGGKPSKSVVIDERGEVAIDGKAIDFRAVRAHVEQFKAVDSEGRHRHRGRRARADRCGRSRRGSDPPRRRFGHHVHDGASWHRAVTRNGRMP